MYKLRSEEEAESRARKRVAHFLELARPSSSPASPPKASSVPTFSILVSPRNEFRSFIAELIGTNDQVRFKMLMELCRETIVEGWDNADAPGTSSDLTQFFGALDDLHTNQYLPALDSVIDAGLMVIKYNADGKWLEAVADLMVESFDACRRLVRFQMYSGGKQDKFPSYWWRPSLELYMGLRAIATYAVLRKRLSFLGAILPHIVTRVTVNRMYSEVQTPVVFWPFAALPFVAGELAEGRAQYFWSERIAASWGSYFGTLSKFVESSSQLELLLEFNSYLATNQIQNPQLQSWVKSKNEAGITFEYLPDLYAQDLEATVPMAESLYDILESGSVFPVFLTVDPQLPMIAFGNLRGTQRLELYGEFLYKLKTWQSQYRQQAFHAFGFMWNWEGRLKTIVQAFADRAKKATSQPDQRT